MREFFETPSYFGGPRDEFLVGVVLVTVVILAGSAIARRWTSTDGHRWLAALFTVGLLAGCGSCWLLGVSLLNGLSRAGG